MDVPPSTWEDSLPPWEDIHCKSCCMAARGRRGGPLSTYLGKAPILRYLASGCHLKPSQNGLNESFTYLDISWAALRKKMPHSLPPQMLLLPVTPPATIHFPLARLVEAANATFSWNRTWLNLGSKSGLQFRDYVDPHMSSVDQNTCHDTHQGMVFGSQ